MRFRGWVGGGGGCLLNSPCMYLTKFYCITIADADADELILIMLLLNHGINVTSVFLIFLFGLEELAAAGPAAAAAARSEAVVFVSTVSSFSNLSTV